jgi:hypothetical protein
MYTPPAATFGKRTSNILRCGRVVSPPSSMSTYGQFAKERVHVRIGDQSDNAFLESLAAEISARRCGLTSTPQMVARSPR